MSNGRHSIMQIYYDHWGKDEVKARKYQFQLKHGLYETCQHLFLFWVKELDYDPRFEDDGPQYRYQSDDDKIRFLRTTMESELSPLLEFYEHYGDRDPFIRLDFLRRIGNRLSPSLAPPLRDTTCHMSDRFHRFHMVRERFRRHHPRVQYSELSKYSVDSLFRVDAILSLA